MNWLGIDVGFIHPAADSDGNVYTWAKRRTGPVGHTLAGHVKIRRADGTESVREPYSPRDMAEVMGRAQDDEFRFRLRGTAQRIVTLAQQTERGIALEDWRGFSKRKAAWVEAWKAISVTAEKRHVPVTQVNRAYTSLTCPQCGHRGRENRPARATFLCVRCKFSGHADVVAAMNIARKAAGEFGTTLGPCENPGCDSPVSWAAGLCVGCYFYRYRNGVLPEKADVARLEERRTERLETQRRIAERRPSVNTGIRERQAESYRTHDAWGEPLTSE